MATLTKKKKARLYAEIAFALLDTTDDLYQPIIAREALKVAYAELK